MDQNTSTQIDPLSMPAGELEEPKFPVLKEGVYRMIMRSFEVATSEKDGKTADRLSIKLETTTDGLDTEDRPCHKGFAFNVAIFLTPNENNTIKKIGEQAAMPVKAALGGQTKVSVRDCINNPSLVLGKFVDVKIGIKKGKDGYNDQNVVKAWVIPA